MMFKSQICKVANFSLPLRFPALRRSNARTGCASNFCATQLRSCAIPVLSLLMASLFMLVSLPAVAQSTPEVSIYRTVPVITEEDSAVFTIIRSREGIDQSLDVTIEVSDNNSAISPDSAISGNVETTLTIPAEKQSLRINIPTQDITPLQDDVDTMIIVSIVENAANYRINPTVNQASFTVQNRSSTLVSVNVPPGGGDAIADGTPIKFILSRETSDLSQPLTVMAKILQVNGPLVHRPGETGFKEFTIPQNASELEILVDTLIVRDDEIDVISQPRIVMTVISDSGSSPNYLVGDDSSSEVNFTGVATEEMTPPEMTPPETTPPVVSEMTAPTVMSVVRHVPVTSLTNADSLTWRVTFSKAVQNVDAADFTVTGVPATTATITNVAAVAGETGVYDVTASGGNLDALNGVVTLSFASGQDIADAVGNMLANTMPTGMNGNSYIVDNMAPMVEYNMIPPSLEVGTPIDDLEPQIIDGDDIASFRTMDLPAGLSIHPMTGVIRGTPMVQSAATTVTITVTDNLGNSAIVMLNFPAVDTDMTDPTVVSITRQDPTISSTNADSLTWRVTFSEAVQNVDAADFTVTGVPATTATITNVAAVTGETGVYDVTVSGGNLAELDAEVTLSFASGQNIADAANNMLANTMPMGTNENSYVLDNTAPTVTITGVPEITNEPFTAMIEFSEAVSGFTLEDIMVSNARLSDFAPASGTNNTDWTVMVAPTANGAVTLNIAADVATDALGNGNLAAQANSVYFLVTVEQPIIDDDTLTLNLGIALDEMREPPNPGAFTVTVGTTEIEVEMVKFGSIVLSLKDELPEGDNAEVSYDASAAGPSPDFPDASPLTTADNQQIGDFDLEFDVLSAAEAAARRAGRPLEAYLPRFGRTVGEQTAAAVRNRISANRSAGFQGQIAGRSIGLRESGDAGQTGARDRAVFLTLLERGTDATSPLPTTSPSSWSLTSEEVLLGTSFAFMRNTDAGMSLGFWGQASQSGFDGHGVAGDIDGRVTGVQLGADWRQGAGLFGLMVSRSRGSGDVAGTTDVTGTMIAAAGEMKSDLTALVPYGGVEVSSTLSLWGAAGLGRGDVTFTSTGGGVSTRTDIDWSMLTGGARGALGNAAALGGASLDWIADALWTKTRSDAILGAPATSGDTMRVRAGVEASWAQVLDSGSIQTPRLSLGLRHDGGDAETGMGLEIGGGFDWRDASGGLSFGVEGRALALHDDGDYRDWGVGLNFSYDPRPDTQRGFSMVFTQGLGVSTSGGVTSLMTSGSFPTTGFDSSDGESRWSVEASHGTSRGLGMVSSPYVRLSGGGADQMRDLRLGYRVGSDASHASDMNLDVWAEPSTNAGQPVEAGASLQWNW